MGDAQLETLTVCVAVEQSVSGGVPEEALDTVSLPVCVPSGVLVPEKTVFVDEWVAVAHRSELRDKRGPDEDGEGDPVVNNRLVGEATPVSIAETV